MRVFFRSLSLLLGFFSVQMKADEREALEHIPVNIAGWGTASQSSVAYDWYPQNALDWNPSTCTHTKNQSNPWWKLDLLKVYSVKRVAITNRRDCCSDRINRAQIRVGNVSSDVNSNPICAVISSIPAGASYSYLCNRMKGRYVFVDIPGTSKILTLCEVEVYVVNPVQMKADEKENIAGWGTASQSSVAYNDYPQHALDRNSSTITHSETESNPWWMLDLLKVYSVNRVVITNRDLEGYSDRINGAEIRVGNVSSDVFSNPICAVISSIPSGASNSYLCNRMEGRYVFVVIPGSYKILTLAEVEVYVVYPDLQNLAIGRNATQSATYESWIAEQAIDFNPGFTQPSLACSHTGSQTNPWWRLDLGQIYRVSKVVVTNRKDYMPERINGAEIHVGNSLDNNGNNNPVCAVISSIPAGVSSTYACNGMEGRYVNLIIPGDSKILTLCEVEVYGEGNLATGRSVTQSSTYESWIAEQAIDFNPGFTRPSLACSSTNLQTNPWWRLQLGQIYRVSKVVVTSRQDCCLERINGAEIRIGNSLENNGNNNPICAVISSIPAGVSSTYACNGMEGRFVNLIIPGDSKILTLCEVEVYAEGLNQIC